jgi:carboxypeptidase Q
MSSSSSGKCATVSLFRFGRSSALVLAGFLFFALGGRGLLAEGGSSQTRALTADVTSAQSLALDQKIMVAAREHSEVLRNLTYLSDEIGPRLTGSSKLRRANEWTAAKMKEYGLSNVHLESWTIPAAWERGPATARLVEPDTGQTLTIAAMAWTQGTNGKVTGDVVVIQNAREMAACKGKLKNAIVLPGPPAHVRPFTEKGWPQVWIGQRPGGATERPAPAAKPSSGGNGKAAPPAKQPAGIGLTDVVSMVREAGFASVLTEFARNEGAAAILRDSAKPHGLLNMSGSWSGSDRASAVAPLPSLYVAHEHYAQLYRLASRPAPARTRVELEVVNKITPGPVAVCNTVGELRGREKPDELVILGAHLDSWDLGQGTTDNGTGSMVVLEAARLLAATGIQPRRTIRFILFSGEEQGLCGSRAYVRQHKEEMKKISMCLVHDTGTGRVESIGLHGSRASLPVMEAELSSLKQVGLGPLSLRACPGSDHLSFIMGGVPGFMCDQNMDEYFLTHHSQTDTLDKANEADLIQGVQVMAVAAMRVANLPTLLPRK